MCIRDRVDSILHSPLGASQVLEGLLVVQVVGWSLRLLYSHQDLLLQRLQVVQVVGCLLHLALRVLEALLVVCCYLHLAHWVHSHQHLLQLGLQVRQVVGCFLLLAQDFQQGSLLEDLRPWELRLQGHCEVAANSSFLPCLIVPSKLCAECDDES